MTTIDATSITNTTNKTSRGNRTTWRIVKWFIYTGYLLTCSIYITRSFGSSLPLKSSEELLIQKPQLPELPKADSNSSSSKRQLRVDHYTILKYNYEAPAFNYEIGDIPEVWDYEALKATLEDFDGRWRLLNSRSDSAEELLSEMGVAPLKRRLVSNFEGITEIQTWRDENAVSFDVYFPANRRVAVTIPIDGSQFLYEEPETGAWISQAIFHRGRIAQVRYGPLGQMFDVRTVFQNDPQMLSRSPVMLFSWTFIPTGSDHVISVKRWLVLES